MKSSRLLFLLIFGLGGNGWGEPIESSPDSSAPRPDYLLQVDDVLSIAVFREPDLTSEGMVRKNGTFEMKLLGPLPVAGRTIDQATAAIQKALAVDYLVNPKVTLTITSYAKKKVNILGEVRTPGLYTFPDHGTLVLADAIAMAGGFLPSAEPQRVAIRREVNGQSQERVVDASPTGGGANTPIFADDAITISLLQKRHFTVLGQVNRPGTYEVQDSRPLYLTDALALAGGYTRLADPSRVLLKRTAQGRESVLKLNALSMARSTSTARVSIENEDTITVSETLF